MERYLDYSIAGDVDTIQGSLVCDLVDECRKENGHPLGVVYEFMKFLIGDEEHTITSADKPTVKFKPSELLSMFDSAIDMLKDEYPILENSK